MCMWGQTGRRINRTVAVLRPVAGSEPWSGSVLRFCVRVFAEDGRFKRVHAEEGLGKTRSYYRWVSVRATRMNIYHGNRSFRQKTIVTTVTGLKTKHKGLFVGMVLFLYCQLWFLYNNTFERDSFPQNLHELKSTMLYCMVVLWYSLKYSWLW